MVLLILQRALAECRRNPRRLPLPPGPKRLPVVGSAFQVPRLKAWEEYARMSKIYGTSFAFMILGVG